MIQFNLLPDVKLEYIRAQRSKRLVLSVAVLISLVSIAILGLMLSVNVLQKKHLSDLSKDINSETSQLQAKPNINTILTVQNQLESLTTLHDQKPAVARLFGYLNQVTPASVSINSLSVDFNAFTVTVTGNADSLSTVNQYVDTLKLTTYKTDSVTTATPAFSNVVLGSFGLNKGSKDANQAASYSVTLAYDKTILDNTQTNVNLSVPTLTTRAQLQNPSDLFSATGGKQ